MIKSLLLKMNSLTKKSNKIAKISKTSSQYSYTISCRSLCSLTISIRSDDLLTGSYCTKQRADHRKRAIRLEMVVPIAYESYVTVLCGHTAMEITGLTGRRKYVRNAQECYTATLR